MKTPLGSDMGYNLLGNFGGKYGSKLESVMNMYKHPPNPPSTHYVLQNA